MQALKGRPSWRDEHRRSRTPLQGLPIESLITQGDAPGYASFALSGLDSFIARRTGRWTLFIVKTVLETSNIYSNDGRAYWSGRFLMVRGV